MRRRLRRILTSPSTAPPVRMIRGAPNVGSPGSCLSFPTSAFARSDTTLQLAWVIGGFVGLALPLKPHLGLFVAAVVLVAWSLFVLVNPVRRTPSRPVAAAAT